MVPFVQCVISGLLMGGIYALVSVGLTLIMGIVELVNFSHADYLMVAMYGAYCLYTYAGLDPYLAMPLVILLMIVVGYVVFKLIINRVLHAKHEFRVMATLSMSLILQNLALMLFRADFRSVRTSYTSAVLQIGDVTVSVPRLIACVVAIAVCLGLYFFLTKTYTGASMRAISQNNRAAQLMGIKLNKTYCFTFVLGITMTAFAACVLVPIYAVYPTMGGTLMLPAFVVVVIGGLSSIPGAMIAGMLVGLVESLSAYLIGSTYQQLAYFVLFILVICFKPGGIGAILSERKKKGVRA